MADTPDPSAIIAKLNQLSQQDLQDPDMRKDALRLSRALTASLDAPADRSVELMFSPFFAMAARIAVDLNLFGILQNSGTPITTAEIAAQSGGEELLVERLLRLLSGIGFVAEAGEDTWKATPTTGAMALQPIMAGHRLVSDMLMNAAVKAPKYFRENGFVSPHEPKDGLIQYGHGTKLVFFEYMKTMPSVLQDFNSFMGSEMGSRTYWLDWYPVEERLLQGYEPGTTLWVDFAGGKGHDSQRFHQAFPNRGPLVLQDLPQVIDNIAPSTVDTAIQRQAFDMLLSAPVPGARVYFVHHVCMNWSDAYCLRILQNIRQAMTPGYSKLLIYEIILPDTGFTALQCIMDMTNMVANAGLLRSKKHWTRLLAEAGLEVVRFWIEDVDSDGVVEAVAK